MSVLGQNVYSTEEIVEVFKKISPRMTDAKPIRVGKQSDGGYILLEDILSKSDGVAYSFGVGKTVSFETEMASKGYKNWMYDHTVRRPVCPNTDQFNFKPYGISTEDTHNMKTIETCIKENGHENRNDILLQCDIEGGEFDIFTNTPQSILKKFSQIIIEYHSLDKCIRNQHHFKNGYMEIWNWDKLKDTLNTLGENFTPYHVHGNNWRGSFDVQGQMVPEVIEVSYVRNDLVNFIDGWQTFPTPLDFPNKKGVPDLQLGSFSWNG